MIRLSDDDIEIVSKDSTVISEDIVRLANNRKVSINLRDVFVSLHRRERENGSSTPKFATEHDVSNSSQE